MSPYGSSVEELKLEGRREQFLNSLPTDFELAEFEPEHNQKIYEEGAKLGVPKEVIDAERAKWLQKNAGKAGSD
jgi:hypothetical protein